LPTGGRPSIGLASIHAGKPARVREGSDEQHEHACPYIEPVAAWLARRHVRPGSPPFFNYVLIGDAQLDIDVGFPLASALEGEGEGDVRAGRFPEGLYAVLRHLGPYDGLKDAHGSRLCGSTCSSVFVRKISAEDLYELKVWRESGPEAPEGAWYKDFGSFQDLW
jgi:hypothetical protein